MAYATTECGTGAKPSPDQRLNLALELKMSLFLNNYEIRGA